MKINNNINTAYKNLTENGTPIIEAGKEVDKNIFLKMLVGQMTNQNPFNPQDPTQYVTQLAQFSMLEQTMKLNSSIQSLLEVNNGVLANSSLQTSAFLIGNHVEVSLKNENADLKKYSGIVKGATIKDGIVHLEIKLDGSEEVKEFPYSSLIKVNKIKEIV
ncbi:flagellar hook assembly protein FlgD [Clostridium cadaveris]|uniref:flagellar hook assembly protein FlgD n=1 Tax=Clostridium cadaveris TaxID=1529 RepID=UPI0015B6F42E|nr:flagellar hook capping FlgD N-terminal domain-containing protein [Clostridium cadaveris]NWK12603.1 flagellar biosynthesis protein FlgD [Clostridium cadaveris]UFH63602.1 flagellar biosynthesis protein FlgD [Clostridium cadaveris]